MLLSFVPEGSLVDAYGVAMCQSQNNGVGVDDYGFHTVIFFGSAYFTALQMPTNSTDIGVEVAMG